MSVYGRYLFRQVASAFLLILLTLTLIVWLATVLRQLNVMTSQGQGFMLFLQMTALALPSLVGMIAPNAYLMALLHTLDRANGDSELIVMTAAGAPASTFARPFIAFAAIVSAILLVINLWLMPASSRQLREFVVQVRTDLIAQVLQPGRFSSPTDGLTFHIRDRDRNGDLLGLVIHDEREPEKSMTYLAERGRIIERDGAGFLAMFDGHVHRSKASAPDDGVQIVAFEQYIFDISRFGDKEDGFYLKTRERYLSELISPAPDDGFAKNNPGRLRAELHDRFATPLYPFVFAVIAIAFLSRPRTTRQSRWGSIAAAFLIAVIVRALGLASSNLAAAHAWAVILIYGVPLGAISFAAWAAQAKLSSQFRADVTAWLQGGVTWVRALSARGMQVR